MTPAELDDLAERMVPIAARFIGVVHDEGVGSVARILDPMTPVERSALTVVLAAMVDPERTPSELLAWVEKGLDRRLPTLFESLVGATPEGDDPAAWTDDKCHRLWCAYRRQPGGEGYDHRQVWALRVGYKEWERRRKIKARAEYPTAL